MKRPNSLTIAGAIWFAIGLLGILGSIVHQHGLQVPDGNILNMLIGVGLWRGWRLCRLYAVFMAGFGFVMMALFLPWSLCHTEEMVYSYPIGLLVDQRPHELMSLFGVILYFAIGLFVSGWMVMVLKRAEVRRFFYDRRVAEMRTSN